MSKEKLYEKQALNTDTLHKGSRPQRPHGRGPSAAMMPGEKARDFKGSIKKLIAFMGQFKLQVLVVFVFAIASTIFNIVGPKVLSEATTELFNGLVAKVSGTGSINFSLVARILLTTFALYFVSAICSWVQGWLMSGVSQKTCYRLREAIVKKFDNLPLAYFDAHSKGDTLSRITNDVDTLGQSLNQGITQLITSATTVIGVLLMMFSINWLLACITLLIVPLSLLVVSLVVKHSQKYFFAQQSQLGDINGKVEESFSGHTVIKAFCQEEAYIDDFKQSNNNLYESAWKSQFLSGLMMPIMNFIGNLGYVAVAVCGSFLAVSGTITVGDIQAFIQYVKNFTQPITQLAQVSNVLQQMAAAAERIFEFIEEPTESETGTEILPTPVQGHLELSHVCFGYKASVPVIKDFSASILPGQTVAIVGPTGAGKTTLVKLLMRFYDYQAGSIKIDGKEISELSRKNVREQFAMVLQDTWLFAGTIAENIAYGKLDATQDEIKQAAKEACAHRFITTLPGGYKFVINEDASNISAGQRQLLTIARALLANKPMLILDEATSNVDTRTEERIQRAMDKLMENRTSFVIAHRLSTIRNADLILVLDHGDIVEQGKHHELLKLGGFYANLYNAQFKGGISDE